MRIGVLGTNFKAAKLDVREALSWACQRKLSPFSEFCRNYSCVILSTCNRVEIYFCAPDLAEAHSELLQLLKEEIGIPFEHQLYSYFGLDCFMHLAHVTAGLDSAIVAESEIQRQVKTSYEQAVLHYRLSSEMHYLFQKALKLGKDMRSDFSFSFNEVTIPKLLFEIGCGTFADIKQTPVLFVGNSQINRQIIAYFKYRGLTNLTVCSRSLQADKEVAEKLGVDTLIWDQLSLWQRYPFVICGSNSSEYLIIPTQEEKKTRLIFDLSMPRTVDPLVGSEESLSLFNMEQLIDLIQERQQQNKLAVQEAKTVIANRVERYLTSFLLKETRVKICV